MIVSQLLTLILNMTDCTLQKFAFQYHLDIGQQNIAKILINQDSDPYVEASKFCAKHGLKSIYITIIGDAIAHQIRMQNQSKSTTKIQSKAQYVQKSLSTQKCQIIESNTMQTQLKQQLQSSQDFSFHKSNSALHIKKRQSSRNLNVFENLYQNHKHVQMKKEMIRKRSFESIPFRPKINHLSQKIVEKKRSQNGRQDVYQPFISLRKQNRLQKSVPISLTYKVTNVNTGIRNVSKQNRVSAQKNKSKSRTKQQKISFDKKQIREHIASKLAENKRYSRNILLR